MGLRQQVREIADEVLARGGDRTDVNLALMTVLSLTIGSGGRGSPQYAQDYPACRYCGAWGGGGHGGFCPQGWGEV